MYTLKYIVKPPLWGNFERRSEMAGSVPVAGGGTLIGWLVMVALVIVAFFAYDYIKKQRAA